jgi:hypothetical protein
MAQAWVFLLRHVLIWCRDWRSLAVTAFIHFIAGGVIGLGANPSNGYLYIPSLSPDVARSLCPGIIRDRCLNEPLSQAGLLNTLFYLCLASLVASACRGISAMTDDLEVISREAFSGRSLSAFMCSKFLAELPVMGLGTMLFVSIFYPAASVNGHVTEYYASLLALEFCGSGIGYVISFLLDDTAMVTGIVTCVALSVGCGSQPTLRSISRTSRILSYIWSVSPARWGGEALYTTEATFYERGGHDIAGGFDVIGYSENRFGWDLIVCVLMGCFFRAAAVFFAFRKEKVHSARSAAI